MTPATLSAGWPENGEIWVDKVNMNYCDNTQLYISNRYLNSEELHYGRQAVPNYGR